MYINGIVAMDKNKGIGKNNSLPWKISEDMRNFKKLTIGNKKNAIIMGKNTYLDVNFLKERDNLVLSSSITLDEKRENNILKSFKNIEELLKFCKTQNYEKIWVIGGSQIYKQFLEMNIIQYLYVTVISNDYNCDTFFPKIPGNYFISNNIPREINENNKIIPISYMILKKIKQGDTVYYKLSKGIIKDVHFDDPPNVYFTVEIEGKEIQTTRDKISLKLNYKS